jgi:DNA-directed RNA polymerase specialized sigma24 family protein
MQTARVSKPTSFKLESSGNVINSIDSPVNKDLCLLISNLLKNKKQLNKYEKFAKKQLFKRTKNLFARHYTGADIIRNIFCKIISGAYHWDSEKLTFDKFMFLRIRTELFNIVKHEIHFIPIDIDSFIIEWITEYNEDENKDDNLTIKEFVQEPDYNLIDQIKEDDFNMNDLMEMAYDLFYDSTLEFCVLDEIYQNRKPKEIAANLGISSQEVRNTVMRIRRRLIAWCKKNNHEKLLNKLLSPAKKNNRSSNNNGKK